MQKTFQTVYKNSPNLQIHHESLYFWINCSSQVTGVHIPSDEFVRNTDNISEICKASCFSLWDHPFKTSACLMGGGVSPCADGPKVTVHKDQKSPS